MPKNNNNEKPEHFPARCRKCIYHTTYPTEMCEYIIITGEPRIDPIDNHCTKYKGRKRKRKNELQ